jgi:hypothetical protein
MDLVPGVARRPTASGALAGSCRDYPGIFGGLRAPVHETPWQCTHEFGNCAVGRTLFTAVEPGKYPVETQTGPTGRHVLIDPSVLGDSICEAFRRGHFMIWFAHVGLCWRIRRFIVSLRLKRVAVYPTSDSRARSILRPAEKARASEIGHAASTAPACIDAVSQVSEISQIVLVVQISAIFDSCRQDEAP